MKAQITYTVHCSHEAFKYALLLHMRNFELHEVEWRKDGHDGDDKTYSIFSWPSYLSPFSKTLFCRMAISALQYDGDKAVFHVCATVKTEEGLTALSIEDAWEPDEKGNEANKENEATMHYRHALFNKDIVDRMAKIAALATDRSDV